MIQCAGGRCSVRGASGCRAVRVGAWKLVSVRDGPWELYDLDTDRTELHDLARQQPERVHAMAEVFEAFAADTSNPQEVQLPR